MGFRHLCDGSDCGLVLRLLMQDDTDHRESGDENECTMDIDSADSGNPLAATEYVEELYKFYRETEVNTCQIMNSETLDVVKIRYAKLSKLNRKHVMSTPLC